MSVLSFLGAVVEKLPSPLEITEDRIEKLMCSHGKRFDKLPQKTQQLKDGKIYVVW